MSIIRRRALAQGKHRDNEWIAFLAASCFVGDAFYWYEELDEDVQNDWSRLRPALVARFGRGVLTSTTPLIISSTPGSAPSTTTVPTPAAAPPIIVSHPSVRKGRLKVLNGDGWRLGYITNSADNFGFYRSLSTLPDDALSVSFAISSVDEPVKIQIIDASQPPRVCDWLAVVWFGEIGSHWIDSSANAATSCSFSTITSKTIWEAKRKVWKISEAGQVSVEYPKLDGGFKPLIEVAKITLFD